MWACQLDARHFEDRNCRAKVPCILSAQGYHGRAHGQLDGQSRSTEIHAIIEATKPPGSFINPMNLTGKISLM